MNNIVLMGRLTADPEIRTYRRDGANKLSGSYTLAVDRPGSDTADFFNCVTFGTVAEFVEKYLRKGMKISIIGQIHDNNYTDKNGVKRYEKQVFVNSHYFCESKGDSREKGRK